MSQQRQTFLLGIPRKVLPEGGIEPPQGYAPSDFESDASANSATPAGWSFYTTIIHLYYQYEGLKTSSLSVIFSCFILFFPHQAVDTF